MLLSVRDIEELIFCPKLFYYHVVLGIERFSGFWKEVGRSFEEQKKEEITNILSKEYIILEDKVYESKRLGLRGRPDIVLRHRKYNHYAIVEVKNSDKAKPEFLGTLFTYAILLEDCGLCPVKEAFLVLRNDIKRYEVSDAERERAYYFLRKAREILNGEVPKGNSKNCYLCDLRGVCDEGGISNK